MTSERTTPPVETTEINPWSFFESYKTSGQGLAMALPDFLSFSHLDEVVKLRDQQLLAKKKAARTDRRAPTAEIEDPGAFVFENFLSSETVRQGWIGETASRTTEYDDWISGVDLVAEWLDDEGRPIRLAIDFTVTVDDERLQKKIEKAGINVRVKYLRSGIEKGAQGKPLEKTQTMPLVVIGVDKEIMREIAKNGQPISPECPLKLILLKQIKAQIDWHLNWLLRKVAEKHKKTERKKPGFLQNLSARLPLKNAGEYCKLFAEFPAEIWNRFMSSTDRQRLNDLVEVKQKIDEELENAKDIKIDEKLKTLLAASATNNRLSNF